MDSKDFSEIVAELAEYHGNEAYEDFQAQNNIGIPAAYMIHSGLLSNPSDRCKVFIYESWELAQRLDVMD